MDKLIDILGAIKRATGIEPTPFYTADTNGLPAITYSFYRTQSDGAKSRHRMQTRVHAKSLEQAMQIESKLTDLLVTVGDETRFGCTIQANGGGSLVDLTAECPQQITYFDILCKEN